MDFASSQINSSRVRPLIFSPHYRNNNATIVNLMSVTAPIHKINDAKTNITIHKLNDAKQILTLDIVFGRWLLRLEGEIVVI